MRNGKNHRNNVEWAEGTKVVHVIESPNITKKNLDYSAWEYIEYPIDGLEYGGYRNIESHKIIKKLEQIKKLTTVLMPR